jgi:hypothetical protein
MPNHNMTVKLLQNSIRMDLLYRLCWNLLTDLHNVQIVLGPEDEEKIIPLFDHSSADESLGVPSLSRVDVNTLE